MEYAPNAQLRYTNTAVMLHWGIAACIAANLLTGLSFDWMAKPSLHFWVRFHASVGMTMLLLTIIRIGWRLTHRPPPLLPMRQWERRLAHPVHLLLYVCMIAIPLTGWVIESSFREAAPPKVGLSGPAPAASKTFLIWDTIPVPKFGFVERQGSGPDGARRLATIHDQSLTVHLVNAWLMVALVVLHIAGALKHQFVDRERELTRIGIGRTRRRASPAGR